MVRKLLPAKAHMRGLLAVAGLFGYRPRFRGGGVAFANFTSSPGDAGRSPPPQFLLP